MDGIAAIATIKPGQENPSPCLVQRLHSAAIVTYAAKAKSNPPAIRLAALSASSENVCPWRSSTDSRHINTPPDASSMRLSSPIAVNTRLPAAMPDAMAIAASTLIQPIVSHSSLNASRIRASRSEDLGGKTNGGGAQHSSRHSVVTFSVWAWLIRFVPMLPAKNIADGWREGGGEDQTAEVIP